MQAHSLLTTTGELRLQFGLEFHKSGFDEYEQQEFCDAFAQAAGLSKGSVFPLALGHKVSAARTAL